MVPATAGAISPHGLPARSTLAHGLELPPPFSFDRLLTEWTFDPGIVVPVLVAAGLYLWGVRRVTARGVAWPVSRTVLWFIGLAVIILATSSAVGVYDSALFSMHSVQHMLLQMIAPAPLGMAAPVTLALRTLPPRPRRVLLAVVHSRLVRTVSHPLVAYGLFVVSPFVLIYSRLFEISLTNDLVHNLTHVHFLLVGCLLYWPLLGVDPLPNPLPFVFRMLLVLGLGPAHIVLGIPVMLKDDLVAPEYFMQVAAAWGSDPLDDQRTGGGLLWVFGDVVVIFMLFGMFVQWSRSEEREKRRIDRHLDRAYGKDAATTPPWWTSEPTEPDAPREPPGVVRDPAARRAGGSPPSSYDRRAELASLHDDE